MGLERLHVDIMDDVLVRNFGFTADVVGRIRSCSSLFIDVHLMAHDFENAARELFSQGASRVIVHLEASGFEEAFESLRSLDKPLGLGIMPSSPVELDSEHARAANCMLLFGVNPGQRGQSLLPSTLPRLQALRSLLNENELNYSIIIDGGVTLDSLAPLVAAGARDLVVGSALYGASAEATSPQRNLEALYRRIADACTPAA